MLSPTYINILSLLISPTFLIATAIGVIIISIITSIVIRYHYYRAHAQINITKVDIIYDLLWLGVVGSMILTLYYYV